MTDSRKRRVTPAKGAIRMSRRYNDMHYRNPMIRIPVIER